RQEEHGYQALVYNLNGQLVAGISRKDSRDKDVELVVRNWKSPWPVDMDQWLHVTLGVKTLPEKTVITSQISGVGDDGRPFTSPLLTAEDASPQRLMQGPAPAFALYAGDNNAGVQVRNLVIRDKHGKVVVDGNTARRAMGIENTAEVANAALDALPQAKLVKMESRLQPGERPDLNSFFPMEIIASEKEQAELLAKHAEAVLLFPEDRTRPIVMPDFIPQKWALEGPQDTFKGTCQPSEYYCWQIGVFAAREEVRQLSITYSDLKNTKGKVIAAKEFTCFNIEGTDHLGRAFTKDFTLGKGLVRPLWIGMMTPDDAEGEYAGNVTIKINGVVEKTIPFRLKVEGPKISHHGDDEPWRHSRLRWLNSTRGLEDDVLPPPFTPVKRDGPSLAILGRDLRAGPLGLPEKITVGRSDVLASPARLDVLGSDGRPLAFEPTGRKVEKETPSRVIETVDSASGDVRASVRAETWFDGAVNYDITLQSRRDAAFQDVGVAIPMRKELAKYFVGFSNRGDRRPASWRWKWDRRYNDNAAWLGGVEAGIGVKLLGETDYWDPAGLHWDEHRRWINDGQGGAALDENGDAVVLRVFTGETRLKADEPLRLRLRLYVTPFKPLRPDHWNLRFFGNIVHYHHSLPQNPYINYPFMTIDALKTSFDEIKARGLRGMTVYYTLREISNIAPELFALRSLGQEVVRSTGALVYGTSGWSIQGEGGGHPWLREHLVAGYSPCWQQTLPTGAVDAAVGTNGDGRLMNYYIEGLAWLQKKLGYVGVYLDGIGYDRIGMMRLARTLGAGGGDYYLPFHTGDDYKNPWSEFHAAPTANYLEHLPYVTQLMWGECFWYDGPEGYWMSQLAGLPFGVDNQFYPVPGPDYPFRVMLYASSENVGQSAQDIRAFWDRWGINEHTRTLGYWDSACPVKTNAPDVFASVYTNPGKALICIGSWAKTAVPVTLAIDWKSLGMDPATVRVTVPDIGGVQKPRENLDLARPIP
ncbi:MAG: hypothetical protein GX621_08880, partial [Pirellulaceae bacterium]|nr:hypothetical protein [Pirellulaceae bacterium]